MRILIPVLGFGRAGGYRVLSEMASAWERFGHTVDFLAPDTSGMPYFPTTARLVWTDQNGRISLENTNREFSPRRGSQILLTLYRGLKNIGNEYDIVLANHSFTAWPVWLARLKNPALFYYIQAFEPEYYYLERRLLGWICSRTSYFLPLEQIANTKIYAKHLGISGKSVVPFGINLETFRPKKKLSNFTGRDQIVLGCIGRAEPAKGTKYVLEAFEKLWAGDRRFRLKVAYGNLPDGWAHDAAEILVPTDDKELAAFYRSLDILITPGTVQHGAPHYPVLEAMASGIPVVHTGYIPGNQKNSWIARNKDSGSIIEQIKMIINSSDIGEKLDRAITDVRAFSWDQVASSMINHFEEFEKRKNF